MIGVRSAAKLWLAAAAIVVASAGSAVADGHRGARRLRLFHTLVPPPTTGTVSMPVAIWATPGEFRIGWQDPAFPDRSTWRSRLTSSVKREASSADCKPVTTTRCRTVSSSAPRSMHRSRAFPNLAGISIGGTSNLTSATLGAETFSETVLASGTVRGRIGYAPGSWLFYATGGFAWTYDRLTLTQLSTGATESPFLWRLGFAVGAGVEAPICAALDRAARISVHRLWHQRHDVLRRRAAVQFRS